MKMFSFKSRNKGYRLSEEENSYIEEATSCVDLEMRMKEVDRGNFRKNKFSF